MTMHGSFSQKVEDPVVVEAHQVGLLARFAATVVGLGQVYRAFHVPTYRLCSPSCYTRR